MAVAIRPAEERDAEAWASLYTGYRAFYELPEDPEAVARTWQWVLAGEHGLFGLVATDATDTPIALANLRWFADPSTASIGLYLDDLFTDPNARGRGTGTALLGRAAELAAAHGATVVSWITASDNETARRLYDRVATATDWVTYEMQPRPRIN